MGQTHVKHSIPSVSFTVAAAQLWNSLPDDIVLADSAVNLSAPTETLSVPVSPTQMLYCNCYPTALL